MIIETFLSFFATTAFGAVSFGNLIMIGIATVVLIVSIKKDAEPLLLIPIAFGMLLANIPILHTGLFAKPTDTTTGGLMYYITMGLQLEIYPPLIFLGIGALTDFSFLLSNPILIFLGGAAQVGVFIAFGLAKAFGFTLPVAAAIGIIGGADGPTSIYIAKRFAPEYIAMIALAAYSYIALMPLLQPPIMKALTTKKERMIRMKPPRQVKKVEKLVFAGATVLFCGLLVPPSIPLVGMLMLGNFLRESGYTKRLAEACSRYILDTATIMLCLSVGGSAKAEVFLQPASLLILGLGCVAFITSIAGGVLFTKFMNLFLKEKINPLVGGAGVSAVPDSARISQQVAKQEDPTNFILMHAMGPNVAGVIGTAVAAGVFLSVLG